MRDRDLLRVDEAADLLNISKWTIYRWVNEGKIQGTKIGRTLRIFRSSVLHLIEENKISVH